MPAITDQQRKMGYDELFRMPEARAHLRKTVGKLSDIPESMYLPPSKAMRERQLSSHLARLHFQGSAEGPELPLWGGLTDFFFECLDAYLDHPTPVAEHSPEAARWDRLLKAAGIPDGRSFSRMLDLYSDELLGCQLADSEDEWCRAKSRYYLSQAAVQMFGHTSTVERSNARIIDFLLHISGVAIDDPLEAELLRLAELPRILAEEHRYVQQRFHPAYNRPTIRARGRKVARVNDDNRMLLWAYWRHRQGNLTLTEAREILDQNSNDNVSKLFDNLHGRIRNCPIVVGYDENCTTPIGPAWVHYPAELLRIAIQHWQQLERAGTRSKLTDLIRASH